MEGEERRRGEEERRGEERRAETCIGWRLSSTRVRYIRRGLCDLREIYSSSRRAPFHLRRDHHSASTASYLRAVSSNPLALLPSVA